ncbi:unnamed protein product, partial [Polarella glacialis]
ILLALLAASSSAMGQKLAGACCSAADFEEASGPDLQTDSYGKPVFFSDDNLGLRIDGMFPLGTASSSGADSIVQEVEVVEVRQDSFICCTPSGKSPPPTRVDGKLIDSHSSLVQKSLDSPRFCSTPRASKQTEWNSTTLLSELNRHARNHSLEFHPVHLLSSSRGQR